MANGRSFQLEDAIEEAAGRVAREGTLHASERDLTLTLFGFLASKIENRPHATISLTLTGKKLFALGSFIGGGIVSAVAAILRLFS